MKQRRIVGCVILCAVCVISKENLWVLLCIPLLLQGKKSLVNTFLQQWRNVGGVVFYAVCVISKGSRWSVLPRTSCYYKWIQLLCLTDKINNVRFELLMAEPMKIIFQNVILCSMTSLPRFQRDIVPISSRFRSKPYKIQAYCLLCLTLVPWRWRQYVSG
jgi:hypothetical protein